MQEDPNTIGIVLAIAVVAAFGYFIYTRIKKSRESKSGTDNRSTRQQ